MCLGTSLRVYRTASHGVMINSSRGSAMQWQGTYQRRLTALETQEKTTETETRTSLATVCACTGRFPAKSGCRPIKLEKYSLAHTYPANSVRVHLRHLGVYKESQVAYRAIRVRVS